MCNVHARYMFFDWVKSGVKFLPSNITIADANHSNFNTCKLVDD